MNYRNRNGILALLGMLFFYGWRNRSSLQSRISGMNMNNFRLQDLRDRFRSRAA